MRRPVRIDKDELDRLAEVKFDWSDVAGLVELATNYRERFQDPPVPDFMSGDSIRSSPTDLEARRAFVEAVEGIWRERRRKRGGSSYRTVIRKRVLIKQLHDGPLLRLLLALFQAMGEPDPPSAATLHHDLDFLRGGRERKHKPPGGCDTGGLL